MEKVCAARHSLLSPDYVGPQECIRDHKGGDIPGRGFEGQLRSFVLSFNQQIFTEQLLCVFQGSGFTTRQTRCLHSWSSDLCQAGVSRTVKLECLC